MKIFLVEIWKIFEKMKMSLRGALLLYELFEREPCWRLTARCQTLELTMFCSFDRHESANDFCIKMGRGNVTARSMIYQALRKFHKNDIFRENSKKYRNRIDTLRVLRAETWLTVYCTIAIREQWLRRDHPPCLGVQRSACLLDRQTIVLGGGVINYRFARPNTCLACIVSSRVSKTRLTVRRLLRVNHRAHSFNSFIDWRGN